MHGEGTLGVVCWSTGPFDGTRRVCVGITTGPRPELDLHWSLGVLVVGCISSVEGANDGAANHPDNAILVPVDSIGVPFTLCVGDFVELAAVVRSSLALSK